MILKAFFKLTKRKLAILIFGMIPLVCISTLIFLNTALHKTEGGASLSEKGFTLMLLPFWIGPFLLLATKKMGGWGALLGLLIIILSYYYFLVCLIDFIYQKIKKKKS